MNTSERSKEDLLPEVRAAWADVLGSTSAENVPLETNFLEAGGNSLLLVMLWEQLQPLATRQLKLSELFQHGTVQAQAALLAGTPEAAKPDVAKPDVAVAAGDPAVPEQRLLLARRRAAATSDGGRATE